MKQSPLKVPVIVQETEKCIDYVCKIRESTIPIWFDKAEEILLSNPQYYDKTLLKIERILKQDVCWRFKDISGKTLDIYELDREKRTVCFSRDMILDLKEYAFVLSQLLNYRWAQLLEKFNNSPRISLKVKGISEAKLRRNNLSKFKEILLLQMEKGHVIDFYTGKILEENDISLDHVIPWSFMYSDDIWNLVITSRSNNSRKSNSIPSENIIRKLEDRNRELIQVMEKKDKMYEELKLAIENDYVQKFYTSCRL